MRWMCGIILASMVVGCGSEESVTLPLRQWDSITFELQTRPEPVRTGVNEFLLIATEQSGLPASDFMISVRANENQPWRQLIQDGHSGVYRRAIPVGAGDAFLDVLVKRKGEEKRLDFPLRPEL